MCLLKFEPSISGSYHALIKYKMLLRARKSKSIMNAWTNHWSPGRQIYRWSPRSCKERQGKPPSTNSNRGVPQDRRWRTSSARPCENLSIQVARESLYYRVAVAVAGPCTFWDNNSVNVRWLIAFVFEIMSRLCDKAAHFFVTICTVRENSRINVKKIIMLTVSNVRGNWKIVRTILYWFCQIKKKKKKEFPLFIEKLFRNFALLSMILCAPWRYF